MNYVEIGSSPCDEPCAQCGKDSSELMRLECRAYLKQLQREFPGGDFRVKASNHDFGTYYEVWCFYSDDPSIALKAESESKTTWDADILAQLQMDAKTLGYTWTPEGWEKS